MLRLLRTGNCLALAAIAGLVAACGGGGGGGGDSPAPVPTGADIVASMSVQRAAALPNQENVVTVSLQNVGGMAASGALVTVPAPSGFTFESASCSATAGASCPSVTVQQLAAGFALPPLPSGGSLSFLLSGISTGSAGSQINFTTSASLSSDLNPANNSTQRSVTIGSPPSATLVTSVPAPTYSVGSAELAAFGWINNERSRCGMGLLKQDTRLDQASLDHANYLAINIDNGNLNNPLTHEQNPGWPGFTGVDGLARAQFRTYPGSSADLLAAITTGQAVLAYQALFGYATFHSQTAQGGRVDVGLGTSRSMLRSLDLPVLNVGIPVLSSTIEQILAASQLLAGDQVVTYPCGGETLLARRHTPENPSPLPGVDLSTRGAPVTIAVRPTQSLRISEFNMTTSAGVAVPGTLLTNAERTNIDVNQAVFIADAPLPANSTLNVLIRGTNEGQRFTKQFSYSAGNAP